MDRISIKNVKVSPKRAFNNGEATVRVSAVVFTTTDGAVVERVELDTSAIKGRSRIDLSFDPDQGLSQTRDGRYSCSLDIPYLTDTGRYELPIKAVDSKGGTGTGHARLQIDYQRPKDLEHIMAPSSRAILDKAAGAVLVPGNQVETLSHGNEAFEKRMALIEEASEQINIQTYTFSSDGMCGRLLEAIVEKAARGVEVNLILNMSTQLAISPITALRLGMQRVGRDLQDLAREIEEALEGRQGLKDMVRDVQDIFERLGLGTQGINVILVDEQAILGKHGKSREMGQRSTKWLEKMAQDQSKLDKDIQKRPSEWRLSFKGPAGLPSLPLLSYAVHEKIMVVDGQKAIVGGRNLEDRYFTHWIDEDVYLEGPIVREVQQGFLKTWQYFSQNLERDLLAKQLIEELPKAGDFDLRFVQSRPWLGQYNTLELLVAAFQMARDRILISSQYIVLPDSLLRDALIEAASRGVQVHILTNSFATIQEVGFSAGYFITLNYCEPLINAGIRVYELNGPEETKGPGCYLHAKEFMIDREWYAMGSFNLSIRSCYIESEQLICIQDRELIQRQEDLFWKRLREDSTEITKEYLDEQKQKHQTRIAMSRYLELFY